MNYAGWVYILTNKHHTVLYVGVTNNLKQRISDHKNKVDPKCFTARYNVTKLVYYSDGFEFFNEAIKYEKFLKGKVRAYKVALVDKSNPTWRELYDDLV
jgi:putative endonuclease